LAVRIGEISRAFKLLAKDHGIPVVVLSQLNREVEHRQGGRPQLSDLRDSGAIEQDADMVMFIHRRMKPTMEGEEEDKSAELLLAKHRNGPTGVVPLYFEGEFATFREMERTTDMD
jgi:replicative DNA helicase